MDFTLLLYSGGQIWFLPFLDHRTRTVLGYALSPSPTAEAALEGYEVVKRRWGKPGMVHHDQGGAFLSREWVGRMLLGEGVRLSYSLLGPQENLVESFFSRFKAENQDLLMESRTLLELKEVIRERVGYYNALLSRRETGLGGCTLGWGTRRHLRPWKVS